jgi:hypothetical protein
MREGFEDLVFMARAAQHDERLSDGALYGKLADAIEALMNENALEVLQRMAAEEVSRTAEALVEYYRAVTAPPDIRTSVARH